MQMIVSSVGAQQRSVTERDMVVVATALDAITWLEGGHVITNVVLADCFATDHALAAFLAETYPTVRIERGR